MQPEDNQILMDLSGRGGYKSSFFPDRKEATPEYFFDIEDGGFYGGAFNEGTKPGYLSPIPYTLEPFRSLSGQTKDSFTTVYSDLLSEKVYLGTDTNEIWEIADATTNVFKKKFTLDDGVTITDLEGYYKNGERYLYYSYLTQDIVHKQTVRPQWWSYDIEVQKSTKTIIHKKGEVDLTNHTFINTSDYPEVENTLVMIGYKKQTKGAPKAFPMCIWKMKYGSYNYSNTFSGANGNSSVDFNINGSWYSFYAAQTTILNTDTLDHEIWSDDLDYMAYYVVSGKSKGQPTLTPSSGNGMNIEKKITQTNNNLLSKFTFTSPVFVKLPIAASSDLGTQRWGSNASQPIHTTWRQNGKGGYFIYLSTRTGNQIYGWDTDTDKDVTKGGALPYNISNIVPSDAISLFIHPDGEHLFYGSPSPLGGGTYAPTIGHINVDPTTGELLSIDTNIYNPSGNYSPFGLTVNKEGTKMYILEYAGIDYLRVREFSFGTPFDVTTLTENSSRKIALSPVGSTGFTSNIVLRNNNKTLFVVAGRSFESLMYEFQFDDEDGDIQKMTEVRRIILPGEANTGSRFTGVGMFPFDDEDKIGYFGYFKSTMSTEGYWMAFEFTQENSYLYTPQEELVRSGDDTSDGIQTLWSTPPVNEKMIDIGVMRLSDGLDIDQHWLSETLNEKITTDSEYIFMRPADNGAMYLFVGNAVHKINGDELGGQNGTIVRNVLKFPKEFTLTDAMDYRSVMNIIINKDKIKHLTPDSRTKVGDVGVYVWDRETYSLSKGKFVEIPGIREIKRIYAPEEGVLRLLCINNDGLVEIRRYGYNDSGGVVFPPIAILPEGAYPTVHDSLSNTGRNRTSWLASNANIYTETSKGIVSISYVAPYVEFQSHLGPTVLTHVNVRFENDGNTTRTYQIYDTVPGGYVSLIRFKQYRGAKAQKIKVHIYDVHTVGGRDVPNNLLTSSDWTYLREENDFNWVFLDSNQEIQLPPSSQYALVIEGEPGFDGTLMGNTTSKVATDAGTFTNNVWTPYGNFNAEIGVLVGDYGLFSDSTFNDEPGRIKTGAMWYGAPWYIEQGKFRRTQNMVGFAYGSGGIGSAYRDNLFGERNRDGQPHDVHPGYAVTGVKVLPIGTNLSRVRIYNAPIKTDSKVLDEEDTIAWVMIYYNQSDDPSRPHGIEKAVSVKEARRGYMDIQTHQPNVNSFQIEIEWNMNILMGDYTYLPYAALIDYKPTKQYSPDNS